MRKRLGSFLRRTLIKNKKALPSLMENTKVSPSLMENKKVSPSLMENRKGYLSMKAIHFESQK